MSEEFILKACKSFRRRVDTITEKNGGHMSKLIILCLCPYSDVYFLNQNQFFNSPILPIDVTLTSTTTPDQSGPGSNDNEGALRGIRATSLDCSVSNPIHSFWWGICRATYNH